MVSDVRDVFILIIPSFLMINIAIAIRFRWKLSLKYRFRVKVNCGMSDSFMVHFCKHRNEQQGNIARITV